MKRLLRAELLRVTTTRTAAWMALAMAGTVLLGLGSAIIGAGDGGQAVLDSSEGVRNMLAAAASGSTLVLLLGVLLVAGEFRHNTATSTFLVTPRRDRVLLAKLVAAGLVGVVFAAGAAVLTLAVGLPWLAAKDVHVSLLSADVAAVLAGALLATVLSGLVGVGIGALIRNQTVAMVVTLVWVMVIEGLLVGLVPAVGKWLPGGAAGALTHTPTARGGLLPMWGGGLLLTAYGMAFAVSACRFTVRRDVA